MKPVVLTVLMLLATRAYSQTPTSLNALELEAQYKTCAQHYIPADKCSPEVYAQLKEHDSTPPDANTAAALRAIQQYRTHLKNPDSLQVHTAYVIVPKCKKCSPEDRTVCLEVGAQNGFGGTSTARIALVTREGKDHWYDESGMFGAMDTHGGEVNRWGGVCTAVPNPFHSNPSLLPGTDVTDKVNKALKTIAAAQ